MSSLNFLPRATPLTGWRIALLAVGVLAMLPSAANWIAQQQTTSRLEARLAAQLAQAQGPRVFRPALAPAQQRELDLQVKAVAEAVRALNLPVTRLIKTIQAPADVRVALLGLDLNGQPSPEAADSSLPSGALKIAAEAETVQDMINYLAFLNQQPMFSTVYLVKHEMAAAPAGGAAAPERPYHFQLEAQWRQ